MKLNIICIILLSLLDWCGEPIDEVYPDLSVEFENDTDEQVSICYRTIMRSYEIFQPNNLVYWPERMDFIVDAHEKKMLDVGYEEQISQRGNIQLLVWKQSTLDRFSQEEIIRKNIYDKRYRFTLSDFKTDNNRIVYNGE